MVASISLSVVENRHATQLSRSIIKLLVPQGRYLFQECVQGHGSVLNSEHFGWCFFDCVNELFFRAC